MMPRSQSREPPPDQHGRTTVSGGIHTSGWDLTQCLLFVIVADGVDILVFGAWQDA